jgi:hypothetical protein
MRGVIGKKNRVKAVFLEKNNVFRGQITPEVIFTISQNRSPEEYRKEPSLYLTVLARANSDFHSLFPPCSSTLAIA